MYNQSKMSRNESQETSEPLHPTDDAEAVECFPGTLKEREYLLHRGQRGPRSMPDETRIRIEAHAVAQIHRTVRGLYI